LTIVDIDLYEQHQSEAAERMKNRDIDDWPIVATDLTLDCPIWTEDKNIP
jgi:predicted nucleic acid-binding protein